MEADTTAMRAEAQADMPAHRPGPTAILDNPWSTEDFGAFRARYILGMGPKYAEWLTRTRAPLEPLIIPTL